MRSVSDISLLEMFCLTLISSAIQSAPVALYKYKETMTYDILITSI